MRLTVVDMPVSIRFSRNPAVFVRFSVVILILAAAASRADDKADNEAALKDRYDAFVKSLDHRSLAEDYPRAVRNLDSADPKKQIVGIKTLAATDELKAIPWIVPLLDSEDLHVRIGAGQALNALVASHQLKRRDKSQPEKVVILPPGPGDIDLKPMSWVVLKMLQKPDDGNTQAFAANMIGYLGLEEYEPELRKLLDSKHPAVTQAARGALQTIGAEMPVATETRLRFDTYSGYFVSNKFEPDQAESFVVIEDQKRFDEIFRVGFVMGDKSHRLPEGAFKSLTVLAAIKRGQAYWEFKVDGMSVTDGVVALRYTATSKESDSATFACPLIVSIPKDKYRAVRFIENKKTVKTVEFWGE